MHRGTKTVCLQGKGNVDSAKMIVYLDRPSFMDDKRGRSFVDESADLLRYMFKRMGIDVETDVYFDYIIKCRGDKKLISQKAARMEVVEACSKYRLVTLQEIKPKAIVALGSVALEAFIGRSDIGEHEGVAWDSGEFGVQCKVWVAYAPDYIFNKASEAPSLYRVLWRAAAQAGLKPQETSIAPYPWKL